MILKENNNDTKKLRNGKYINIDSTSGLNKINGDSRIVKRKINGAEELEAKSAMLTLKEKIICNDNPDLILTNQQQSDSGDESENIQKKTKTENTTKTEESKILSQKSVNVNQKCEYCCQKLISTDIKIYPGHPNGAVEEMIALTDPRLSLFTGEEVAVHESDVRPQNKLTHFW